jgi:hypothetical protein
MMNRHTLHAAYEAAFPPDGSENPESIWLRMLDSLRRDHPSASIPDQDSLCESASEDGTQIRYGRAAESGFWTVEVCSMATGDHWSAYLLPMPDGSWRTGWMRTASMLGQEPVCWVEVVAHLVLGRQVQPHHPPTFMSLIAAMSSAVAPRFSQVDRSTIDALTTELDDQRRFIREQAVQLRALRTSLATSVSDATDAPPTKRWTLAEIGSWAKENAERIVIMPRAIAEGKKSVYEDHDLVFAALNLLADVYPRVRSGQLPRDELVKQCRELNLSIGGSVDPGRAGQSGDEYFVSWRGRRRFLEQHLGKGSSRDLRHCLRIYFFFDEALQLVVVGHLPSHLTNSLT